MKALKDVLAEHFVDREKCACGELSFDWETGDLMQWPAQWASHVENVLHDELGIVDVFHGEHRFSAAIDAAAGVGTTRPVSPADVRVTRHSG